MLCLGYRAKNNLLLFFYSENIYIPDSVYALFGKRLQFLKAINSEHMLFISVDSKSCFHSHFLSVSTIMHDIFNA